jgi:hypothetical protein
VLGPHGRSAARATRNDLHPPITETFPKTSPEGQALRLISQAAGGRLVRHFDDAPWPERDGILGDQPMQCAIVNEVRSPSPHCTTAYVHAPGGGRYQDWNGVAAGAVALWPLSPQGVPGSLGGNPAEVRLLPLTAADTLRPVGSESPPLVVGLCVFRRLGCSVSVVRRLPSGPILDLGGVPDRTIRHGRDQLILGPRLMVKRSGCSGCSRFHRDRLGDRGAPLIIRLTSDAP